MKLPAPTCDLEITEDTQLLATYGVSDSVEHRIACASNANNTKQNIRALFSDNELEVRTAAACNHALPSTMVESFLADESFDLRTAIKISSRPELTTRSQEILVDYFDDLGLFATLEIANSELPPTLSKILAQTSHWEVRKRIAELTWDQPTLEILGHDKILSTAAIAVSKISDLIYLEKIDDEKQELRDALALNKYFPTIEKLKIIHKVTNQVKTYIAKNSENNELLEILAFEKDLHGILAGNRFANYEVLETVLLNTKDLDILFNLAKHPNAESYIKLEAIEALIKSVDERADSLAAFLIRQTTFKGLEIRDGKVRFSLWDYLNSQTEDSDGNEVPRFGSYFLSNGLPKLTKKPLTLAALLMIPREGRFFMPLFLNEKRTNFPLEWRNPHANLLARNLDMPYPHINLVIQSLYSTNSLGIEFAMQLLEFKPEIGPAICKSNSLGVQEVRVLASTTFGRLTSHESRRKLIYGLKLEDGYVLNELNSLFCLEIMNRDDAETWSRVTDLWFSHQCCKNIDEAKLRHLPVNIDFLISKELEKDVGFGDFNFYSPDDDDEFEED
jgi:hypothetical protein